MLPTGRALSAPLAVVLVAFAGGFGLSRAPGFCRTLAPSPLPCSDDQRPLGGGEAGARPAVLFAERAIDQ